MEDLNFGNMIDNFIAIAESIQLFDVKPLCYENTDEWMYGRLASDFWNLMRIFPFNLSFVYWWQIYGRAMFLLPFLYVSCNSVRSDDSCYHYYGYAYYVYFFL